MGDRVLVCGGRDYRNRAAVDLTLYALHAARPIAMSWRWQPRALPPEDGREPLRAAASPGAPDNG